jgi:hypothetical protein
MILVSFVNARAGLNVTKFSKENNLFYSLSIHLLLFFCVISKPISSDIQKSSYNHLRL